MILWTMAFVILVDTVLVCILFVLNYKNAKQIEMRQARYIKLEEWAEDWLKRLEQKHEALECQIVNAATRIAEMERKHKEMEELLPKGGNGELIRNQILLQQMNDEMERGLRMEKEWNDSVNAILNYGKPITEVKTNE